MRKLHIVDAWLANLELERLEIYLRRGRPFVNVPLEELRSRWVALMRAWANSVRGFDHREREDIEAEMKMRKIEPPFDLAKDAIEILRRKSKERERMRDPTQARRVRVKLNEEIERFRGTTKGRKN